MRIRDMVSPTFLYKDGKRVTIEAIEVEDMEAQGWSDSPARPEAAAPTPVAEQTPAQARAARKAAAREAAKEA